MKKNNINLILKHKEELEKIMSSLEDIQNEEEERYESKSENWQNSEKGEQAKECLDYLESILGDLRFACSNVDDIISIS